MVEGRLHRVGQRYTANRRALVDVARRGSEGRWRSPIMLGGKRTCPRAPPTGTSRCSRRPGSIRRVVTEDDFARYELDEDLTEHHHHLVCSNCGRSRTSTSPPASSGRSAGPWIVSPKARASPSVGHRLDLIGRCAAALLREAATPDARTLRLRVENHDVRRSTPSRAPGLSVIAGIVAVCTVIGLWALWPSGDPGPDVSALASFEGVYAATTEERTEVPCAGADGSTRCLSVTFRLLEGPDEGTTVTVELPANSTRVVGVEPGRRVLLGHQPDVEGFEYVYLEPDRRPPLLALAGLFAVAVVALGGWKGARALVGLLATLLVLFLFVVPAILDGTRSPPRVARRIRRDRVRRAVPLARRRREDDGRAPRDARRPALCRDPRGRVHGRRRDRRDWRARRPCS